MGLFFQTEEFRGSLRSIMSFPPVTQVKQLWVGSSFVDFCCKTLIKFHFTFCVGFETLSELHLAQREQ